MNAGFSRIAVASNAPPADHAAKQTRSGLALKEFVLARIYSMAKFRSAAASDKNGLG
jgi:hypothetical protein